MAVGVSFLAVDFTIGGKKLKLRSDQLAELNELDEDPKYQKLSAQLKEKYRDMLIERNKRDGITYKIEGEEKLEVTFRDFVDWLKSLSSAWAKPIALPEGVGPVVGVPGSQVNSPASPDLLGGIGVTLWEFSFSTKMAFTVKLQLVLKDDFRKALKIPEAITHFLTLDSIGFGISYTREETEAERTKREEAEAASKEKEEQIQADVDAVLGA